MLAERANLDMDHAFNCLRNYARRHNMQLASVAQDFVEGTLTAESVDRLVAP